jgi:transposase
MNLSHWTEERIEAFRRLLKGEYDLHPDGFEVESGRIVGTLYVLRELLRRLKIEQALGKSRQGKLCALMVCARVAAQGSRLSSVRWAKNHAVSELLNIHHFTEDDLYAALDWLAEQQEQIENALYREYIKRNGTPPVLVLYDVTSSYFEGLYNELAEYGYNRDGKRGKKQIVIGLLTDSNGEPLALQGFRGVFRGNTADPQTLQSQIETLKTRFKIKEIVFVGDRGMIKTMGKNCLAENGSRYITALTDPQILALLRKGTLQYGLFDEQVHEVIIDQKRYILRRNPFVQQKEERRRNDKLIRLQRLIENRNSYVQTHPRANAQKGLATLQTWVMRHKISRFVTLRLEGAALKLLIDEEARRQDALLDGCYVIETDVPTSLMKAKEVHRSYLSLQKVEQDFRSMKTTLLEVRPIFLRKRNRTRAHVFVALLALNVSRHFHAALRPLERQYPHLSVADALDALSRLIFLNFRSSTTLVTRLQRPDTLQTDILHALNIKLPQKM